MLYSDAKWVGRSAGGWEAQEGGEYVYTELIYFVVQQEPTQYCKTTMKVKVVSHV